MDSLITAAARALAAGDPLGALKRVALRDDPPALALRGIAMAQLGDYARARDLLRRAARAFGASEAVSRARCIVAEAEIAFASRDLAWPAKALDAARATLAEHGDVANAAHAQLLSLRRLLLLGRLDAAANALEKLDPAPLPPALQAVHALIAAGIAMRRLQAAPAQAALAIAVRAAAQAGIPALAAEVENARQLLAAPAARVAAAGTTRVLQLADVETLLRSGTLVVDACRHAVCAAELSRSLAGRPVLFVLLRTLAEAWPADVSRDHLVARAFRARRADESYRARLRVEIGRLRKALRGLADLRATTGGFVLAPLHASEVAVLSWPHDEVHTAVLALLTDGEAWASSALALALGSSQRTVQRELDALASAGKVQAFGHGRARRWVMPPLPGFTTSLLLTPPLPAD